MLFRHRLDTVFAVGQMMIPVREVLYAPVKTVKIGYFKFKACPIQPKLTLALEELDVFGLA